MKLSEMEKACRELRWEHGDLEIAGGFINDDSGVKKIVALDSEGVEVNRAIGTKASCAFIE